ncbi:MAG: FecR domain-containing protein [Desulfobacterales bacterium]|nr:FecR domain-containing protein [Desulfobacterales bacterium]
MKPIRSFMVLALLILFPVAAHAAMVGNVTHVTGRVDITSPGETARPANVGDEVNQDDIIRTKSNSKAEVTFLDGNILRLAEETRVEIAEYVMEEEQVTGVLNLFRGKLQNIVSTIGKEFGRDKQNHFEVHTATAVCGVRGTNFFPWFQRGVSGATFQEGEGYVYSKGRPDEERTVHAGQTALVVSADQPPMVRPATDEEMGEHVEDTFPSEAEDDDEGDDEGEGEGEGDGEGGTPEGYEPPEDEGLGEPEGGDDTTPPPPPPPYIPPDVPTEPTTTTYTDFSSPVEFSFLEGEGDFATLSGSINDDTNQGTLSLSGTSLDFPTEGIWGGDVGATLSDGSGLEGGLAGISGTWEGLLTSIYVTGDGGAGYIYGDLSGDFNETNNTFAGSGSATRSPILGYTDITPDGLADALLEDSLFEGYPVPILGSIDVGSAIWPDDSEEFGIRGIETNSGRLLGVWGATTGGEGGTYFNDPGLAAWYGIYGDPSGDYYMLGVVSGIDDSAGQTLVEDQVGHVSINGGLYYLDPYYQGYISIEYRGTYCDVTGYYESVGAGTYTLDPLAYSGYWDWGFAPGFLLCNNEDGSIYLDEEVGLAGIQYGLIGGLIAPWDGPADFLAMGEYDDFESGGTYLWNSFIYDNEIEDGGDGGYFKGFTGGTWKGGIMEGAARAIYVSPPDPENNNLSTAGILTGDLLGNYYEMEEDEWIYGMWIAVGSLTPEEMATYLNPANVNINYAGLLASLAGHFGSDGSIEIYGEQGYWLDCMDWGITLFIYDDSSGTSLPWGIYDLKLGNNNYYVGKSGDEIDWLAVVGGYGGFDDSYEGYWLASVDGTWKATSATTDSNESGEITGGLAGRYLTPFQMGTIQGPFFGLYDQDGVCQESGGYGTWIGESIGTFEGEPLAFSGDWGTESCCTLLNNNYGDINRAGKDYGNFGLASNQDGSYEFLAMGNYVDWGGYGGAYVWSTSLYGDEVTQDGGSGNSDIFGFTGGFWKEDTDEENWPFIMNGAARVITMDSYGNVSLLAGNISGNYYEMGYGFDYYWWEEGDLGMWIAEGSLEPVAGTETVLNPDYEYSIDWGGLQDARLAGYFIGSGPSGNIYGEQYQEQYTSFITYYDGSDYKSLPWGIYNLKLGSNNYYNNPDDISSSWAIVGGEGQFDNSYEGYWLATVKADWENGEIAGNVGEVAGEPDTFGRYLTPYQMGHIQGPLFGLYDGPDEDGDGTWIGESIGTFEGEPLAFSSSFDGDTYRLVEGRSYAGDFERSDGYGGYDAYYNYEYFISDESGDLLFGENWEDCYVSGNESGDVYLPDGTYVGISDGPLPMSFTRGSWSVGTMSDSDFSDPPECTWDRHWYESGTPTV